MSCGGAADRPDHTLYPRRLQGIKRKTVYHTVMSSKTWQGDIGVATAILHFQRIHPDAVVSVPTTEHSKYDLVVDYDGKMQRVQVKTSTARPTNDKYEVQLRTNGANYTTKSNVTKISSELVDLVFILTGDGHAYVIPAEMLDGRTTVRMSGMWHTNYHVGQYLPIPSYDNAGVA